MKKILVTFGKDSQKECIETIVAAGAEPVEALSTMRPDEWRRAFSGCSGLMLAGGGDVAPERYSLKLSPAERREFIRYEDLARDEMELELAQKAVVSDMPVLAICRGIQTLNVALGGTLYHDVPTQISPQVNHGSREGERLFHDVTWTSGSRLTKELGMDYPRVNSSHHQSLQRVANGLIPIAHAPDGVIEAVENPSATFLVGVQFHPERLWEDDPKFLELFRLFVA